jgi:hypothetical protein
MPDLYSEILEFELMNFNRNQIIEDYAHHVVEDMDLDTLIQFAYDTIVDRMFDLTDVEIKEEVENYYPELLE